MIRSRLQRVSYLWAWDLHGWRKGSVLSWLHPESRTGVWSGKPSSGGGGRQWWLSHLVKLSSQSISIRKGGPLCLGLSPCGDRVHKCGPAPGTLHWQCWVPQLSLCRGRPAHPTHATIRNSSYCHCSYFHTMCQLSLGRALLRDMGRGHLLAGAEEDVASHLLPTLELGPLCLRTQEAQPSVLWA